MNALVIPALGDHARDLQGKPENVWSLRHSAERPLIDGSRLRNTRNRGHRRRAQQFDKLTNHFRNRKTHRPVVRFKVRHRTLLFLFPLHHTEYTTNIPKPKHKPFTTPDARSDNSPRS
ncbi:MAG: hypothetical protein ACXWNP_08670 [Vulcanimicrobiaceae bacterium]